MLHGGKPLLPVERSLYRCAQPRGASTRRSPPSREPRVRNSELMRKSRFTERGGLKISSFKFQPTHGRTRLHSCHDCFPQLHINCRVVADAMQQCCAGPRGRPTHSRLGRLCTWQSCFHRLPHSLSPRTWSCVGSLPFSIFPFFSHAPFLYFLFCRHCSLLSLF